SAIVRRRARRVNSSRRSSKSASRLVVTTVFAKRATTLYSYSRNLLHSSEQIHDLNGFARPARSRHFSESTSAMSTTAREASSPGTYCAIGDEQTKTASKSLSETRRWTSRRIFRDAKEPRESGRLHARLTATHAR